jgi:subtilisin family serine protease
MAQSIYAPDRILVQPRVGTTAGSLARFHAAQKARVLRTFDGIGRLQILALPDGATVPGSIASYQRSGLVEFAEPDYLVQAALTPNDPKYVDGTTWGLNKIEAPAAWNVLTSATNIIVAVLDTGIRYTHEDLAANMWTNPGDGSHGWNAIAGTTNVLDDSGSSHGTLMAGVIGAVGNNGKGLAGVAWQVQLMACKCLNSAGNGTNSDIITCMEFARTNGAKVFNASWSFIGGSPSLALSNAIYAARNAGVIFVTASGNNFPTVNIDTTACYPANFQIDNIVTLCYTTATDTLGTVSNYGATNVDLAAPGESIYSTSNGSDTNYFTPSGGGTSFAAAFASGAFALMLAEYPAETPQRIIGRALSSVDPVPGLAGKCKTGGRLNLRKALTPVRLTGSAAPGGGPFQLHLSATTNLTCILQASANLTAWSPLYTNNTATSGSFDFTDNDSTNAARRLYRAVVGP